MQAYKIVAAFCGSLLMSTCAILPQTHVLSKKDSITALITSAHNSATALANCKIDDNGEGLIAEKLIVDGDIVFDVGANKGDWSAHALAHHQHLTLYIFEPMPHMCDILARRFEHQAQTTIHCCALSSSNTLEKFYCYANTCLSSLYERSSVSWLSVENVITVPTTTLQDFCQQRAISHINFLKIDTEGAEYAILAGADSLIRSHAIDFIQFEYGGTYYDAGTTLKSVFDMCTKNGYLVARITPSGLTPITDWDDTLEDFLYTNFLAIAPHCTPCSIDVSGSTGV